MFRRIATGWAAAFPRSAGAKEALAVSLEIEGDPASIDSVRAALRSATDPAQRLRLVTALVWLDVKFGLPDDARRLTDARRLADSVLATTARTTASADYLGRLAALTGRCATIDTLVRLGKKVVTGPAPIPEGALADIEARTLAVTLGCNLPASSESLDQLAERAGVSSMPIPVRDLTQSLLFARVVRNSERDDHAWLDRLASRDFLIAARLDLANARPDSARRRMNVVETGRQGMLPGDLTPDAALPETRLWIALGDSAKARAWLDRSLANSRYFHPMDSEDAVDNLIMAASMVRAMALRAQLSPTSAERRQWAAGVLLLWEQADPDLQPIVRRMHDLSK